MSTTLKEGIKYDTDKARYDLISAYSLHELAKVYTYGAKKYEDRNMEKGMKWGRIFGAAMRHAWAFWRGDEVDSESGLPHLAHCAWGFITLLEYSKYRREFDDRSQFSKEIDCDKTDK